jgi:hypothetical protein
MSITADMSKTPGARQHNRGWMKMLREERRVKAAERNMSREEKLLVEIFTTEDEIEEMLLTPSEVIQLEAALDEAENTPKPRTRRRSSVTRKRTSDA